MSSSSPASEYSSLLPWLAGVVKPESMRLPLPRAAELDAFRFGGILRNVTDQRQRVLRPSPHYIELGFSGDSHSVNVRYSRGTELPFGRGGCRSEDETDGGGDMYM